MRYIRRIAALALVCALALGLSGCGEDERYDAQIFAMDTVMSLTAYGSSGEAGLTGGPKRD